MESDTVADGVSRRRFLLGVAGAAGATSLAGCAESESWWAVLQAVWENEAVLANASVSKPGGWTTSATVTLNPSFSICDAGEDERYFIITVTDSGSIGSDGVQGWISYRHPCEPSRTPPTVDVHEGVYRVLVNSGGPGGDPLAEYELQVSKDTEYRDVDGGRSA